ncbi:S8 family serine peptidase [Altibacter sp.]|uniref:S8 family serine peptidase n=1 Tax=Altibacter sp. TaxID=2024823 RepID=UPI000C91DA5D|nr:S8 family serine peptidase [Altibacter sp.]MAP54303.1 hypothetical protein [Altibacter sp.]
MKKAVFFLLFICSINVVFTQNQQSYYIELKDGYDLGGIQRTTHSDGTISITTNINDFSSIINAKTVYSFEKAFPTAETPRLQRVYVITMDSNSQINDISTRNEVERVVINEEIVFTDGSMPVTDTSPIYPNDYDDIITGGRNAALELINAPLAWTITAGDPNVLVGVADSKFDLNHEDLNGQMIDNIILVNNTTNHGTGVAGGIAAKTNNNVGIAGLAYNAKLVGATCGGYASGLINGLLVLSNYPGVRVINCSWVICEQSPSKQFLDDVIAEVTENGVLVVAAAGNGVIGNSCGADGNGYAYPASYDATLSVTSVGARFPIGYHHNIVNPDGNIYWERSWLDIHEFRPHVPSETHSHTHNDKVDVSAPGQLVLAITDKYDEHPSGYRIASATSITTPYVTGLAALIFSVNPSLTLFEVKDIIRNTTDDIYCIPHNQPYIGLLGTGRINAYRAVLTAQCTLNPAPGLDLAMQDSHVDGFAEPNTATTQPWRSEDIWVRNQNDGKLIKEHQNPEYDPNNSNYVYVRVTNNSCQASTGGDNLKLYWSKANTSLQWPLHWEGNFSIENPPGSGNFVLMGDEIGTITIPPLGIGEEAIIEFEWTNMPNPQDYININSNPWHFCLLARIDTPNDPMTFPEGISIVQNVLNNNNIAWKNTTVVDIIPDISSLIGGVVGVGNPFSTTKTYNLELSKEANETGKSIYEEAEVTLEMDDVLYNAWVRGGRLSHNLDSTRISRTKIIKGNNARLDNIQFNPNELGTAYITFNFLTKESTSKREFIYHLAQRDNDTDEVIGGETFEIKRIPRDTFTADAGQDKEIDKNENITISAEQINEAAIYNWYDPAGNLIYTGTDLTVSPNVTQTYKLEIISDIDGYKDYDEVEVIVNPYSLNTLVPNPASSIVTVSYEADEATSAYLMVVDTHSGTSNNYILDTELFEAVIDISNYQPGFYSVALICDGEIVASKNLVKE